MLHEKPPDFKENIQRFKTGNFFTFLFLWVILALLDPDPDYRPDPDKVNRKNSGLVNSTVPTWENRWEKTNIFSQNMWQIVSVRFYFPLSWLHGWIWGPCKTGVAKLVSASHFAFERYRTGTVCTVPYVRHCSYCPQDYLRYLHQENIKWKQAIGIGPVVQVSNFFDQRFWGGPSITYGTTYSPRTDYKIIVFSPLVLSPFAVCTEGIVANTLLGKLILFSGLLCATWPELEFFPRFQKVPFHPTPLTVQGSRASVHCLLVRSFLTIFFQVVR
jgi:hypothetical protein